MDCPKVSVVICTYNQQDFVRETVESVLAQTYPHLEIIITDDGSTDATPHILSEYARRFPDKVKLALTDKNTGIPSNINRGLKMRTGELIVCLDGDDLMLPQKVERQVAFLQQHPEATGCYHDVEVFESETGRTLGRMSELYNGTSALKQGEIQAWFVPRNYFLPSAIMFRASACPAHGYDVRMKHLSEAVFFVEVFRSGTLLAMDDQLVRYRRHSRNITADATARNVSQEYELMAYAILEARYPELHPLLKRLRVSCRLTEAVKCYREGSRSRGWAIIRNVMSEGALIQGLVVLVAVLLLGRSIAEFTAGQPYQRPGWTKKLARLILRG